MKKIFIVDYGLGNIHSAQQSIKKVIEEENQQAEVCVTDSAKDLHFATHIILPGQGAFASCMNGLKNIPGICPWPSQGNYILCEFADNQAVRIYNELASRGIFVRNFKSERLKNCFRIAIGKPEESDAFIKVVSKIL